MLLTQPDDIFFANQRFAAGEEAGVDTKLFPLSEHLIHDFVAEILLISVLCRPAASTMHISGRRWIHKNDPRNIALVFLGCFF